jgi:hypothetical protein
MLGFHALGIQNIDTVHIVNTVNAEPHRAFDVLSGNNYGNVSANNNERIAVLASLAALLGNQYLIEMLKAVNDIPTQQWQDVEAKKHALAIVLSHFDNRAEIEKAARTLFTSIDFHTMFRPDSRNEKSTYPRLINLAMEYKTVAGIDHTLRFNTLNAMFADAALRSTTIDSTGLVMPDALLNTILLPYAGAPAGQNYAQLMATFEANRTFVKYVDRFRTPTALDVAVGAINLISLLCIASCHIPFYLTTSVLINSTIYPLCAVGMALVQPYIKDLKTEVKLLYVSNLKFDIAQFLTALRIEEQFDLAIFFFGRTGQFMFDLPDNVKLLAETAYSSVRNLLGLNNPVVINNAEPQGHVQALAAEQQAAPQAFALNQLD